MRFSLFSFCIFFSCFTFIFKHRLLTFQRNVYSDRSIEKIFSSLSYSIYLTENGHEKYSKNFTSKTSPPLSLTQTSVVFQRRINKFPDSRNFPKNRFIFLIKSSTAKSFSITYVSKTEIPLLLCNILFDFHLP